MSRSRGSSDLPQRPSPRAPLHLKTTACSEANALHRLVVDRPSTKLDDRRSPRSPLHEIQKKRGTKVTDLETKLSKAQVELKNLRDQLASAEAAKLDAEEALQKAKQQIPALSAAVRKAAEEEEKPPSPLSPPPPTEDSHGQPNVEHEERSVILRATAEVLEVAAVPSEVITDEKEVEEIKAMTSTEKEKDFSSKDEGDVIVAGEEMKKEEQEEEEEDKRLAEEIGEGEPEATKPVGPQESPEVVELKNDIFEKEREVEFLLEENAIFKRKAKEAAEKMSAAARAKDEELTAKLRSTEEELKASRAKAERLGEQLETAEGAKATLEAELSRLKVQTDQWRKAAESAASMLADSDGEFAGRRATERWGSMVKHIGGGGGGLFADWGSSLMASEMEEDGGGRRKAGAGIRMFGDLWKKKGQQK